MFFRDVHFWEVGKPPVKLLGWILERTVDGFRLMINPQLIEDIVQDSGLARSTRKCATASVKDGSQRSTRTFDYKWVACCSFQYNTQWDSSRGTPRASLCNASFDCCRRHVARSWNSSRRDVWCSPPWQMPAERRTVTGCVLLTGCCVASWSQTQASCALCRTKRHGKRGSGSFGSACLSGGTGFLERAACRVGRQFVGSAVGTSSGNRSS